MESTNLRLLGRSAFYTGFSFFFLDFYIQILGVALKASALEIGLFTAAVFVAQIVSHPIAGVLADRTGRSRTLAIGAFGRVISLVLVGVAFALSSGTLITIGRAFQGLAAGFFWTSSSAIVADETETRGRTAEFGRISLWVNRGMLVGAFGGLLLLLVRLDSPPYFFAGAAIVSGIYALKIRPALIVHQIAAGNGLPLESGSKRLQVTAGLALLNFLNSAGILTISAFLTVYVTETVFPSDLAVSTRAVLIALANSPQVFLLAFLASRLARIGDSIGRLKSLGISLFAMIPISYGMIWIRELWHLAVLGLLLALASVIFGAAFNSIVGDVYNARRGFAYGGLNMSFSVGAALGSFLGGLLFPLGWQTLILTSMLIQAMSVSGLALIWKGKYSLIGQRERVPSPQFTFGRGNGKEDL